MRPLTLHVGRGLGPHGRGCDRTVEIFRGDGDRDRRDCHVVTIQLEPQDIILQPDVAGDAPRISRVGKRLLDIGDGRQTVLGQRDHAQDELHNVLSKLIVE